LIWVISITGVAIVFAGFMCCVGGFFFYKGSLSRQVSHHGDEGSNKTPTKIYEDESFSGPSKTDSSNEEKQEENSLNGVYHDIPPTF